jgi:hypothetical protein
LLSGASLPRCRVRPPGVPVIFGVLTTDDLEQVRLLVPCMARARALG